MATSVLFDSFERFVSKDEQASVMACRFTYKKNGGKSIFTISVKFKKNQKLVHIMKKKVNL